MLGMPVGLGADWLPCGSTSLLAEIKVARRCLPEQGHAPKAKKLVEMVTSDAAQIAGLDDKLGKLAQDRPGRSALSSSAATRTRGRTSSRPSRRGSSS